MMTKKQKQAQVRLLTYARSLSAVLTELARSAEKQLQCLQARNETVRDSLAEAAAEHQQNATTVLTIAELEQLSADLLLLFEFATRTRDGIIKIQPPPLDGIIKN